MSRRSIEEDVLSALEMLRDEHIRFHPRARLAPYRDLIAEMRALDPPVPWNRIARVLRADGIQISSQALQRAFSPKEGNPE